MALVDDFENNREIILRDHLALERTRLANERTLFSYLRTSLYLLTAGIGILEIRSAWHLRWLGWICLALSVVIVFLGVYRFVVMKRHIDGFGDSGRAQ